MATKDANKGKQNCTETQGNVRPKHNRQHPWLYIFSIFILVLIVVTFIGAPLFTGSSGGNSLVFGKYNGKDIEFVPGNYLSRQKDALAEQLSASGQNTNVDQAAFQVWLGAYQNTVIHTAILDTADESGVQITEDSIDKALANYSGYQENGQFSAERYRSTPNLEKAQIRKYYREELIASQYRNDLKYGTKTPEAEKDFIKAMTTPEYSFTYQRINFDKFPEDQVAKYAEENSNFFRKTNISRITLQSGKDAADSVLKQLNEDPTLFDELARTQSKDGYAESGGYIGWQYFYSLSSELEDETAVAAIFSLKTGEFSTVIETSYGWLIYKCNEAASEADITNQDDIDTVRSYMERFEKGTIEDYLVSVAEKVKVSAAGTGISGKFFDNFEAGETDPAPLNYSNIEIFKPMEDASGSGILKSASSNEGFLTAIYSLKKGEISDPLVLNDNVFLFSVKEIIEPGEDSLRSTGAYYAYLSQSYTEQDMASMILSSDKLEDKFVEVFSKYFLSN